MYISKVHWLTCLSSIRNDRFISCKNVVLNEIVFFSFLFFMKLIFFYSKLMATQKQKLKAKAGTSVCLFSAVCKTPSVLDDISTIQNRSSDSLERGPTTIFRNNSDIPSHLFILRPKLEVHFCFLLERFKLRHISQNCCWVSRRLDVPEGRSSSAHSGNDRSSRRQTSKSFPNFTNHSHHRMLGSFGLDRHHLKRS